MITRVLTFDLKDRSHVMKEVGEKRYLEMIMLGNSRA